jgi:hypothetical protein
MARPPRDGVDYFPLDVGFLRDEKLRFVKGEFGAKGILIYLHILCSIYEENGYYKKWSDDISILVSEEIGCGCDFNTIGHVVQGLIRRGLFDGRLSSTFGVLTSPGIQRRYLRAAVSRDDILIVKEYWLLDDDNPKDVPAGVRRKLAFISQTDTGNPVKTTGNPLKESKGKDTCIILSDNTLAQTPSDGQKDAPEGDGFDTFWAAYPVKRDKAKARGAWKKLKPDAELQKVMLEALAREKTTRQWQEENGRYIPYPSTWINKKRWEDEITEGETKNGRTRKAWDDDE